VDVLSVLNVNDGVPSVVVSGVLDMMMLFDVPEVDTCEVVTSVLDIVVDGTVVTELVE